jgi:hypothetical protein
VKRTNSNKEIIKWKSYWKQDNVAPLNIILFELDLNIKFPLLLLIHLPSDFKCIIFFMKAFRRSKLDIELFSSVYKNCK